MLLLGFPQNHYGKKTHSVALGSLLSGRSDPTARNLEETSSRLVLLRSEVADNRSDKGRRESLDHLFGPNGSGHRRTGVRRNRVREDIVLLAFDGEGLREAENGACAGRQRLPPEE